MVPPATVALKSYNPRPRPVPPQTTRALFKPQHQPNRQLFEAKKLTMVNVHSEQLPALQQVVPPFDWDDKWRMFTRKKMAGVRQTLVSILELEQQVGWQRPDASTCAGDLRFWVVAVWQVTHEP